MTPSRSPCALLVIMFMMWTTNHYSSVLAYDNGLGLTPPMGWNSWNKFGCDISQDLIEEMADAMVSLGLQELGYEYINLDDCWQIGRNETGYIIEDFSKFPNGIPYLADYVHSLGLKFGLYSDSGWFTCQRRPGSYNHEIQDATIYAEWNVDYLKYDNCFSLPLTVKQRYQTMHDALNGTGRPIFYSMCEWGLDNPATWAGPMGNSWRTTDDISPNWNSITEIIDINNRWHEYAGPGHWNDPDMLEVGNGNTLTIAEQKSHFTLWALMKAPLLLGNDLRLLSKNSTTMDIISNTEIIAINQDPLGIQGYRIDETTNEDGLEVWVAPMSNNDLVVVLFNQTPMTNTIIAFWREIGIDVDSAVMNVRDLWQHEDLGQSIGYVSAVVESHDVVALRLSPVEETE